MHPIKQFLEENGYKLVDCGENWRTSAKFRNGKNATSLSINKKTGKFTDFGSNLFGSAEQLTKLVLGQEVSFEGYQPPEEEVETIEVEKIISPDVLKSHLPQYQLFLDRGIKKEVLEEFQAGMAHSGVLYKRIVFPIYNRRGQIIGLTGRYFKKEVPPNYVKWRHEGKTRNFLFPCHLNDSILNCSESIILVESPGDLLALWNIGVKNVLCLFGVRISQKLLAYVLAKNPNRIILALNNDSHHDKVNTGKVQTQKLIEKLLKHFNQEQIINASPKEKNDLGAMTTPELQAWAKEYEIHY